MLLSDLLKVINASNFVGIHELKADGKNYDIIYEGQIKTKEEWNRVIKKYGRREVIGLDASVYEGQLIYIKAERQ